MKKKKNTKAKKKTTVKDVFKGFWRILVLFAYVKFYVLCLVGVMLTYLTSMYVLIQEGHDVTGMAEKTKMIGYWGIAWIAIIMADKLRKQWNEGKDE